MFRWIKGSPSNPLLFCNEWTIIDLGCCKLVHFHRNSSSYATAFLLVWAWHTYPCCHIALVFGHYHTPRGILGQVSIQWKMEVICNSLWIWSFPIHLLHCWIPFHVGKCHGILCTHAISLVHFWNKYHCDHLLLQYLQVNNYVQSQARVI